MIIILMLLFLSFLQTITWPVDLIMIILISRSFLVEDKINFYLAFFFGLFISLLLGQPLGILSLIYLLVVATVALLKKTQFISNWLMILPFGSILLLVAQFIQGLLLGFSLSPRSILIGSVMILPVYLLLRFWEERFIAGKEVRLNLGSRK